jgi:hypothetical protein
MSQRFHFWFRGINTAKHATNFKTLCGLKAIANTRLKVHGLALSINGITPADVPFEFQLYRATSAGTDASALIDQATTVSDANAGVCSLNMAQAEAPSFLWTRGEIAASAWTTEPTVLAMPNGLVLPMYVHEQSRWQLSQSFENPLELLGSTTNAERLNLRVQQNNASDYAVTGYWDISVG